MWATGYVATSGIVTRIGRWETCDQDLRPAGGSAGRTRGTRPELEMRDSGSSLVRLSGYIGLIGGRGGG
jgi:hypothetical protein